MKKQFYFCAVVLALVSIALSFTSCGKMKPVRELEELVEVIREDGNTYGLSEWKNAIEQYNAINEEITRHYSDYSVKQKARINKARSEFKSLAKDAALNSLDIIPGLKDKVMEMLQSVFDKFDTNIEE